MENGGYDVELVDLLPQDFYCVVCMCLIKEAVQLNCGHILCEVCLDNIEKTSKQSGVKVQCPSRCEMPIQPTIRVPFVDRVIKTAKAKCRNFDCDWIGDVSYLEKHISTDCNYEEIICVQCNASMLRKELSVHQVHCKWRGVICQFCQNNFVYMNLQNHLRTCKFYPIQCPNKCGEEVIRNMVDQHLDTCSFQKLDCPFQDLGCTVSVSRKDLDDHIHSFTNSHMLLLLTICTETKEELKDTKKQLEKTENELRECKEEMEHTKEELKQNKEELLITKEDLRQTNEHNKKDLEQTIEELKKTNDQLGVNKNELKQVNEEVLDNKKELKEITQRLVEVEADIRQTKHEIQHSKEEDRSKRKQELKEKYKMALKEIKTRGFEYIHDEIFWKDDAITFEGLCCCDDTIVHMRNDYNNTLLHDTVSNNKIACMKVLLRFAPHLVNEVTNYNITALMQAASIGNVECVKLLLRHGAKYNVKNSFGDTALDIARSNQLDEIVKLLEHYRKSK